VLIDSLLYQIVTRWTVFTSSFTIVFVFFATIAATAFDVISASTLSIGIVTLKRQGSNGVAFTSFTSIVRESELVGSTRIASKTNNTRTAKALSISNVTGGVE
jgi:hypothetical protein